MCCTVPSTPANISKQPLACPKPQYTQCMVWGTKIYGHTAVECLFCKIRSETAPSTALVRFWADKYLSCGHHSHKGGLHSTPNPGRQEKAVFQVLETNPRVSFCSIEQQTSVSKSTMQHYFQQELRTFQNKLQIDTFFTNDDRHTDIHFIASLAQNLWIMTNTWKASLI